MTLPLDAAAVGRRWRRCDRKPLVGSGSRGCRLCRPYNVSKAGIENLTRTIAIECAKDGIRANCVVPGIIDGTTLDILEKEPQQRETLSPCIHRDVSELRKKWPRLSYCSRPMRRRLRPACCCPSIVASSPRKLAPEIRRSPVADRSIDAVLADRVRSRAAVGAPSSRISKRLTRSGAGGMIARHRGRGKGVAVLAPRAGADAHGAAALSVNRVCGRDRVSYRPYSDNRFYPGVISEDRRAEALDL